MMILSVGLGVLSVRGSGRRDESDSDPDEIKARTASDRRFRLLLLC